jgi:DNA mismatch repair protein MutS2
MNAASAFEKKIGFDTLRQLLRENCLSPPGRKHADDMVFLTQSGELEVLLNQTEEFRQILLSDLNFPSQDYYDMIPELLRLRVEGTYLEPDTLAELDLSLRSILQILGFFKGPRAEMFPHLARLTRDITVEKEIPARIGRILDEKAQVRDDASPLLKKIRKERKTKEAAVEKKILQSFRLARDSGWTPDDAGISVKNGRPVIPLLSTHKRKISGIIQDESATGQTVFLEPADVFEANNEIRELEYADRREVIRILTVFADLLRPHIEPLLQAYAFLGWIDFVRAKALLAVRLHASLPQKIHPVPGISWKAAVHPLLFLSHETQGKPVVPLDLDLDERNRILIVSGPNAGGKSVCLKTAGLLQYMLQCGILPSAREDSEFGLFRKILLDIGDEQSLENDVSTYTSKLLNIKFFLEELDDHSFFLIDEFGTGTDPVLGGAIAEASLEEMNRRNSFGIITTHYPNLKVLAGRIPGVINGAMLFDTKNMRPLFQLKAGKPGNSFAFEIARQIGFPENVLEKAASRTGKGPLDYEKELQELESEKKELSKKGTELRVADEFLNELIAKYQKLTRELEQSRKEILEKAKAEAHSILSDSNKLIEKTIKEIRESQADKERTKTARQEVKGLAEKLKAEAGEKGQQVNGSTSQQVNGSTSQQVNGSTGQRGTESQIRRISPISSAPSRPYQSLIDDLNKKLQAFQLVLDIRGKRAEEAQSLLQHYIDDAIVLNINEVRILHGKGNGILRQITREYLAGIKEVKKFQDAPLESGGSGITMVTFR